MQLVGRLKLVGRLLVQLVGSLLSLLQLIGRLLSLKLLSRLLSLVEIGGLRELISRRLQLSRGLMRELVGRCLLGEGVGRRLQLIGGRRGLRLRSLRRHIECSGRRRIGRGSSRGSRRIRLRGTGRSRRLWHGGASLLGRVLSRLQLGVWVVSHPDHGGGLF